MRSLLLVLALTGCSTPTDTADTSKPSVDADGDGYAEDVDCDETDAAIHPDAAEVCDGIDNDCDALVDDADSGLDPTSADTWFPDADGDGYGDPLSPIAACSQPDGAGTNDDDCDDTNASIHPGGVEVCDGADDDCDSLVDDDDPGLDVGTASTWYTDADGDGYGVTDSPVAACAVPEGAAEEPGDCDDTDATKNPGAAEVCDDVDNDCDGDVDDEDRSLDTSSAPTWYNDADGDTFGDPGVVFRTCEKPANAVTDTTDCDDGDAAVYPGAPELCDGQDDDCDDVVDDDDPDVVDQPTWYVDDDSDGYGVDGTGVVTCDAPAYTSTTAGDCDDDDFSIHPGATEICDEWDNDCDGLVDDADPSVADQGTWYVDADLDGYGDPASALLACTAPDDALLSIGSDCDDTRADVNPAATEVCDGVDNTCEGLVDDADPAVDLSTTVPWYSDADGDGYGSTTVLATTCTPPDASSADSSDCDDADAAVSPGAVEVCDGADQNCDGVVDFGTTVPDDYATLQAAADAVADGSTICVAAGAYAEDLVLGARTLSIEGYGADSTDWTGSVVVSGGGLTLARLTLNGGIDMAETALVLNEVDAFGTDLPTVEVDGGTLTLTDSAFYDSAGGGAIVQVGGTLTADGVEFVGNLCDGDGAAIYARNVDGVALTDVDFMDNEAIGDGGAVWVEGPLTGTRLDLRGNTAGGDGGGLWVSGAVTLQNLYVAGNTAVDGAGAALTLSSDSTLTNVDFYGNSATTAGGALYLTQTAAFVIDNAGLVGNAAPAGGAISASASSTVGPDIVYSNVYDDGSSWFDNVSSPSSLDGNITSVPGYTYTGGTDPSAWDFTLSSSSACKDVGDPAILDVDGSRSDVGGGGGPEGSGW